MDRTAEKTRKSVSQLFSCGGPGNNPGRERNVPHRFLPTPWEIRYPDQKSVTLIVSNEKLEPNAQTGPATSKQNGRSGDAYGRTRI